ncbi:MAG: hypothetical protein KGZ39_08140 [Simkania sp.]|nr:hypothetical protein [Simkania sp.]
MLTLTVMPIPLAIVRLEPSFSIPSWGMEGAELKLSALSRKGTYDKNRMSWRSTL